MHDKQSKAVKMLKKCFLHCRFQTRTTSPFSLNGAEGIRRAQHFRRLQSLLVHQRKGRIESHFMQTSINTQQIQLQPVWTALWKAQRRANKGHGQTQTQAPAANNALPEQTIRDFVKSLSHHMQGCLVQNCG